MNFFTLILTQPLANGLIFFYRILGGNLGLAIIAFSLALRFILNPLTKPYIESMKKMRDLTPQINKLKKKYKNDKVKLAQAQADLYKEKKINPGAGCLPYLLQIVVLIAFFNVFMRTLNGNGDPAASFNELLYAPLMFAEGEILNTHFLYLDLIRPDTFTLPGIGFPLPGPILILAALIQFLSSKMMLPYSKAEEKVAKKTPEVTDDMQVMIQKSMIYTFPLITLVIGVRFPAALSLYWLIFSITQAYQQYKTQGWGGLTPWLAKTKLIKS
jgi:YidC/Oxa1 family membrane protein insertase